MKSYRLLGLAACLVCCSGVAGVMFILHRNVPVLPSPEPWPATHLEPTAPSEAVSVAFEGVDDAHTGEKPPREAVDPSTLGLALAQRPGAAADPLTHWMGIDPAVLPDPRLRKVLLVVEKGVESGNNTGRVHWMPEALLKLMTERRYWYCGPTAACPAYKNTADVRYVATSLPGSKDEPPMKVVFELTRQEFPRAFEKQDGKRNDDLARQEFLRAVKQRNK